MCYKKKSFPLNLVLCSILFIFFDLFTFYAYGYGKVTDNGTLLLFVIIMTVSAVVFTVYAVVETVNHFIILGYMRDDKCIMCTDFKSDIVEVHTHSDDDWNSETSYYSVTFAEIVDSRGKIRTLKSKKYPINHNPFEDGRTEIRIFIDIDKPFSPYYMYPYSENMR